MKMTLEDKIYIRSIIYSKLDKLKNGSDEVFDKISDELMKNIIDVSFKYSKVEQDEVFDYFYEIMNEI